MIVAERLLLDWPLTRNAMSLHVLGLENGHLGDMLRLLPALKVDSGHLYAHHSRQEWNRVLLPNVS